jgi:hypothetical protein
MNDTSWNSSVLSMRRKIIKNTSSGRVARGAQHKPIGSGPKAQGNEEKT